MFNLDNYEDVNARITRFRAEFPSGRLEAYIEDINIEAGYILVKALAYREYEDEKPSAIDYAFESRDANRINANWWVENAVTSAYGRVIGALTPSTARPTRQDMERAQQLESTPIKPAEGFQTASEAIAELKAKLGGRLQSEAPKCVHGHRIKTEGISNKSGKPYLGYKCPERSKTKQCEMVWFRQTHDGKDWLSPDDWVEYMNDRGRNLDPVHEREPVPEELLSDSERAAR